MISKRVRIVNTNHKEGEYVWYKVGDIFEVRPYRHVPDMYWELIEWNGVTGMGDNTSHKYWVCKENAEEMPPFVEGETLFKVE